MPTFPNMTIEHIIWENTSAEVTSEFMELQRFIVGHLKYTFKIWKYLDRFIKDENYMNLRMTYKIIWNILETKYGIPILVSHMMINSTWIISRLTINSTKCKKPVHCYMLKTCFVAKFYIFADHVRYLLRCRGHAVQA